MQVLGETDGARALRSLLETGSVQFCDWGEASVRWDERVGMKAEHALQVAEREEDRAGAAAAAQAVLFAEVGEPGADFGVATGGADARFVLQAVDAAVSRAHLAAREGGDGFLGAAPDLGERELEVCGAKAHGRTSLKGPLGFRKQLSSAGIWG